MKGEVLFFIVLLIINCGKPQEKKELPLHEKPVEVYNARVRWNDEKIGIESFSEVITYEYDRKKVYSSSITGIIRDKRGHTYEIKAEGGVYDERTGKGELYNPEIKGREERFHGKLLDGFFQSPLSFVVTECTGNSGRFSLSARKCKIMVDEEVIELSGDVRCTVLPEEK